MSNSNELENRRILVIDDNPAIHSDFKKILGAGFEAGVPLSAVEAELFGAESHLPQQSSFDIDTASQGQEGLEKVRKANAEGRPYALAFVDVRMPPGWDGVETTQQLWKEDPSLQVVICTAYADYSWEEVVRGLGHSDRLLILKKPFDNIEVLQLAHALSKKWSVTQALRRQLAGLDGEVARRTRELEASSVRLKQEMIEKIQAQDALRQSQKMEAVGQLAAGVAHDFNNLLTIITGHAGLRLSAGGLDRASKESLENIYEAAERAASLTRQLLAFSRKQVMQMQIFDLGAVVDNMGKMLRRLVGEDITLKTRAEGKSALVEADAAMVEQILLNLAANSRDAMPRGGEIIIATSTRNIGENDAKVLAEGRPGTFACIEFSDSGCGMPPEIVSRIFEPFFTTKEVGRGTGLGLATVYGIVKQHDGWLHVTSTVGKGTTFSIYLPATSKTVAIQSDRASQPASPRGVQETVLLVEDEPILRELVRKILEPQGYEVIEASSGREALGLWKDIKERVSLLLTDMVMPEGMSGGELANRLSEDKPSLKVLFTSGYSADSVGHYHELHDTIFLSKPYPPHELAQRVRRCLDSTRALRRARSY